MVKKNSSKTAKGNWYLLEGVVDNNCLSMPGLWTFTMYLEFVFRFHKKSAYNMIK